METIRSRKRLLDFAPNFYSGIASVLMPRKNSKRMCETIKERKVNDGLYEDWLAVGNDIRTAMTKFNTEVSWQRK